MGIPEHLEISSTGYPLSYSSGINRYLSSEVENIFSNSNSVNSKISFNFWSDDCSSFSTAILEISFCKSESCVSFDSTSFFTLSDIQSL